MKKLIIIGAGPGGYEVAFEAAKEGLDVTLIEKHKVGGTCLNYGCIPTKTLYRSAEIAKILDKSTKLGIESSYTVNMKHVIKNKDDVVSKLAKGIEFLIKKHNIKFVYGEASFVDSKTVKVEDELISGDYFLIATGSTASILPIPGVDSESVITSKEALELENVPKSLTVIGGGVVGLELASIYNYLGSDVTVLEYQKNLLGMFEEDVTKRFKGVLKKQGVNVITSAEVKEISGNKTIYNIKDETYSIEAEYILMAVGRKPYFDNLGLENTNIRFSANGIEVDEHFMTSEENVYAVGDCIGGMMLAHTATYQSYYVLSHILNKTNLTDFNYTPACVFTYPEIASIGYTRSQAQEKYDNIEIKKSMYSANGKANAMDETEGFIQIILSDGFVVGAAIMGYSASTIIHEIATIIHSGKKLEEYRDMIYAHPTLSEVLGMLIRE